MVRFPTCRGGRCLPVGDRHYPHVHCVSARLPGCHRRGTLEPHPGSNGHPHIPAGHSVREPLGRISRAAVLPHRRLPNRRHYHHRVHENAVTPLGPGGFAVLAALGLQPWMLPVALAVIVLLSLGISKVRELITDRKPRP